MKMNQLKEAAREMGYEVVEHETTVYFKSSHATFVALMQNGRFVRGTKPGGLRAKTTQFNSVKKLHEAMVEAWKRSQEVAK